MELENKRQIEIIEPYKLPEGWKWDFAKNLADIYTGNSINETVKQEKYFGQMQGLNFIGTKDVDFDGTINYENGVKINDYENFKTAPANTPLLCIEGGSAGRKLGFSEVEICFGNKLCAFVCKGINPKLVYYYLQSDFFYHCFMKERHGLIGGVSVNTLKQIPFPVPPINSQLSIVNSIETMFAKLDQAQEKAKSVLDSFETRKAAILHKAFSGQLRIENEELKIEDWEKKSFSDLGIANLGKMLDANKNTGNEVRYLRNVNVRWFDFDLSDLLTMRAKPEEIKKLSVKKGDLFICEGGEPGRCAVWKDEDADFIFQKAIHRFRPNEGVSSEFVAYELYYLNQIGKLSDYFTGTTIKHLTGQSLAKVPIKLPPLNYQLSIVNFLDTVLEKESRAKEAAQTVLDQIALLKKSILARAFRGEL